MLKNKYTHTHHILKEDKIERYTSRRLLPQKNSSRVIYLALGVSIPLNVTHPELICATYFYDISGVR